MTNLQTLRIIFGHANINDVLLRCFFDKARPRSIRRLWLENCRISVGCSTRLLNHPLQLPVELDFGGLESIRFRRLPLRPAVPLEKAYPHDQFVHARGGTAADLINGAGGLYPTTTNGVFHEIEMNELACSRANV